jgi:hypothetical protein
LPLSEIFLLDFGTPPIVWYFLLFLFSFYNLFLVYVIVLYFDL